jgi:hypothetical protein
MYRKDLHSSLAQMGERILPPHDIKIQSVSKAATRTARHRAQVNAAQKIGRVAHSSKWTTATASRQGGRGLGCHEKRNVEAFR